MNDISPKELRERLNSGEKLVIIDVREEWEYEEKNIGALNIPLNSIPEELNQLLEFKKKEIIVHCKSGKRSGQAKKYLTQHEFTHVRSLIGGFDQYLND
ncbi:MAG: rhodanese-related sulfurtransferase [Marinoscillum sp.]|jgi:rhodanese-related sulfurtransferase